MKNVARVFVLMLMFTTVTAHAQQSATIWFFRAVGPANQDAEVHWISMPTHVLATLKNGEFFGLAVRPGVYSFAYVHAPAQNQGVVVAVKEGEQAYIEVTPRSIDFAPAERGIAAIQAGRSINRTDQTDAAIITGVPRAADATPMVASSSAVAAGSRVTMTPVLPARRQDPMNPADVGAVRRFELDWHPSYMRLGSMDAVGSELEFTGNINNLVGIAGRIGGYRDLDFPNDSVYIFSWQAGPVFRSRLGRVSVGTHVLAGAMRAEIQLRAGSVSVSAGQNGFMGAVGSRVDVALLRWFSIRAVNAEYTPTYFDGDWFNAGKIGAGIVFRFGRAY